MRLSEFKDEKAIEVVAALLEPISRIAANPDNQKARNKGGNAVLFAQAILKNNAADVKEMLAILNDENPKTYHCTAASLITDVFTMASDPDLMSLFGFQSKMPPTSGSASGSTKGQSK